MSGYSTRLHLATLLILLLCACSASDQAAPTGEAFPPNATPFSTSAADTPTPLPLASVTRPATPTLATNQSDASQNPPPTPDFMQGSWQAGTGMPQPARSEMPAVRLGEQIYVPGGFDGFERLERYDPATGQWERLADLPEGRHHLMATAHNDQLYLFGGAQGIGWAPTSTSWRYDPATDQWQTLTPMPENRMAGAAVSLDDKIYVIGGTGGGEALLVFTAESGTWQMQPGPDQPREHVSAAAFQGEIWVLGGRWQGVGELNTVEIYSPAQNRWRPGPALNVARAGFGAAAVGNHLIVAGGEVIINGSETLGSVEILTSDQAAWQVGPSLPVPIHGVGAAAYDNQLFLLGGSLRAGDIENEGNVQIFSPKSP